MKPLLYSMGDNPAPNQEVSGIVGARHKIIVGLDFGTTFSGVSWVTTDKRDIDDINIISTWPGDLSVAWKTPSRIAYHQENLGLQSNKWGYEVEPKHESYSWTKLLLDKNAEVGDFDDPALTDMNGTGLMKLPVFRTAPEVCEDYLREIYKYVSGILKQKLSEGTFDLTPMECWVTLPAIWSEEAKDATLRAARNAGFGSREDDRVHTIAEPEAAAIATLKKYAGITVVNIVQPQEHVLICDCGGGTVDVTTYTITQVFPRLSFDELCVGVGGKCGATYIDRNLHSFLSRRFGADFDFVPHAQKGPGSLLMSCFEKIKRSFGSNEDFGIRELHPLGMDIPNSEHYDEEERIVKLSYDDIKGLFDPVVNEIIRLVSQQVTEARLKKGADINRIILVGGFGDSPYLNKALAKWCTDNGSIKLMCPENPQSAIVRGAALRGLEGLAPRMKQARRHYGFSWSLDFREGIDLEENAYIDEFLDLKLCRGRMKWAIAKGEPIFKDTYRSFNCAYPYSPGSPVTFRISLYSSSLNVAQERQDDHRVEHVGTIVSRFPAGFDFGDAVCSIFSLRLQRMVYNLAFQIQVVFGDQGENLTFRTKVNGRFQGITDIEFPRS